MKYGGALPSQVVTTLLGEFISGAVESNVRPGSLDLRLSGEVYRVNASFLPLGDETVFAAIRRAGGIRLDGDKISLEKGVAYAVKLEEGINKLPRSVYAYCNPKSSSGRVDVHVRLLTDRSPRFDSVAEGYAGPLWLLVVPKTFPVLISAGLSLNQMRFFNQDTRLDELRLEASFANEGGLLFDQEGRMIGYENLRYSDRDGSILLSLGLGFAQAGFKAIERGGPIDLSLVGHYDPKYFFEPITVCDDSLVLESDTFYILSTKESVRVPASMACEMAPMDERSGEHRSHYAGFIDPGWGVGGEGVGRPLTLEVRSFDSRIFIRDGQPIAKIRYERMVEAPQKHYDEMNPTYGTQAGPRLAKYFKEG